MKFFKILIAILTITTVAISCGTKKIDMTMEDYIKIDIEITETDQKPESKSNIAKKYGFSLLQYEEFAKKVEGDPKLIEKRGEIQLKMQKKPK